MPQSVSFFELTKRALHFIGTYRILWIFVLPFGALFVMSIVDTSSLESLQSIIIENPTQLSHTHLLSIVPLIGTALLFSFAQTLLRGPLLWLMHKRLSAATEQQTLTSAELFRSIGITLLFHIPFFLALLSIGLLLFLPVGLAWKFNPPIFPIILEIAILIFLSLTLYSHLIKEFAYFFSLFGKTHWLSSLNLSQRLFRRYSFLTILFTLYLFLLSLFFSISIDIFSSLSLIPTSDSALSSLWIDIPFFGFFLILEESLRLLFFRAIATTKSSRLKAKNQTPSTEEVPGPTTA